MKAAETIPFGHPIHATGGEWRRSTVAGMHAVARRPTSANGTWRRSGDQPHSYEAGDEVEAMKDGSLLMFFPEKSTIREGVVVLANETKYVRIANGKVAE